jgi:hypothetical protein
MTRSADALAAAVASTREAGLPLGRVVEILWPEALPKEREVAFNPFGGMWRRLIAFVGGGIAYELRARRGGGPWRTLSAPLPDAVPQSWERSEFTIGGKHREVRLFQTPIHQKRGGGPRPTYDWAPANAALLRKLEEDGAPADGDGGQAELERLAAATFGPDHAPAESLIRKNVRKAIIAYRNSLDGEATN